MSSLPPPSFIDDTHTFPHRAPKILNRTQIAHWLNTNTSDINTSTYTGSYYDDGADMLAASGRAPGLGVVDEQFYMPRKKKDTHGRPWNEDIERAVAGDIHRSMKKVREMGGLEVRKGDAGDGKRGKRGRGGIVVQVPGKWGTFVIRDDDEKRVIVVEEDGEEFDSGPRVKIDDEKEKRKSGIDREKGRWVRARSSTKSKSVRDQKENRRRAGDHRDTEVPAPPLKELSKIPDSRYECVSDESGEVVSPTGFFMTGGLSGWPSREGSFVTSVKNNKTRTSWQDDLDNVSIKTSSTYQPPMIESVQDTSSESFTTIDNLASRSGRRSTNTVDTRTRSPSQDSYDSIATEKPPSNVGWPASIQSSASLSWHSNTVKNNGSCTTSRTSSGVPRSTSVQNWVAGKVSTLSNTSGQQSSHRNHTFKARDTSQPQSAIPSVMSTTSSEVEWDGFERPKSMSEVSVVVSKRSDGWRRSKVGSELSAASTHASRRTRYSPAKHRSGGSVHSSHSDWSRSRKADVGGWGGDDTTSDTTDDPWEKQSRGGSRRSRSKYANGFDEDNETYLNATWDGVAVRVDSRRTSAAGWSN